MLNFYEKTIFQERPIIRFVSLFLFIIIVQPQAINAQSKSIRFEHLDFEKGIPHNYIYSIIQDHYGFMWFGTLYGLVKYDGNQYREYTHDPENIHSISSDETISILEDSKGNIWVGTIEGGLNKFNRDTEEFTKFYHIHSDSTTLSDNTVWCIQEDKNGIIWAGTSNGLNRLKFNKSGENIQIEITRFLFCKDSFNNNKNNFIRSILFDHAGRLWISIFGEGLHFYNQEKGEIIRLSSLKDNIVSIFEDGSHTLWLATWGQGLIKVILHDEADITSETVEFIAYRKGPEGLISDYIWSLEEDSFGNLWIGTYSGLNKFDRDRIKFSLYRHSEYDTRTLSSNQIASLCEDKSGILWIGAFQGGIDKYISHTNKFQHIKHDPFDPNSLSLNNIGSLFEDSKGYLWIGTLGGGLNRYDQEKSEFLHFQNSSVNPDKLSGSFITSVCEDTAGVLWIGTYNGIKYFGKDGKLKRFLQKTDKPNEENSLLINTIYADRFGSVWVGTGRDGLHRIESASVSTGKYEQFSYDPADSNSLCHNNVLAISEDKEGVIWVGTYDGLNKVIIDTNDSQREVIQFKRFKFDKINPESISNNNIYNIYEDKNGLLWIGTNIGLNKFDRENNKFSSYTEKDGLPNNIINGILEDSSGNLWLSTNKGLSKFDPINEVFKNFDTQDGLQSNVFGLNTNCFLKSGQLAFGGINGVNIFDPSNITSNNYVPPIVITDVKNYGESIKTGKDITEVDEITLSYEDKFFTIEFSALDFTNPEKNQYAYKLEGFDDDWIYRGNKNYADYTNIDPGSYLFKVIGSNNDCIWNEEGATLRITILPPFWQTLWFRILLFVIFLSGLYLLIYIIKTREKRNSEIREKMTELRIQALRAKMNPHFIFNTINSIQYYLTCNEKGKALKYLSKFARLMRLTLEFSDKTTISISEELELLRLYLDLEKLRFENKFDYKIEIDPEIDTLSIMIPNLIIQPYVENAVKHGIQNKSGNGMVKVRLKKTNNEINYIIEDNGIGIKRSLELKQQDDIQKKSSGMYITHNRISLLNLERMENDNLKITDLSEENAEKTGTKVSIRIPIINMSDTKL